MLTDLGTGICVRGSDEGLLVAQATQCANNSRSSDQVLSAPMQPREPSRSPRRRLLRLSAEQVTQLAADREAGAEINDLAERYGIDRSTVIAHLHRAGVPGRRRQGRTLGAERIQEAGSLYASGVNLLDVAAQFDVDRRYLMTTATYNIIRIAALDTATA